MQVQVLIPQICQRRMEEILESQARKYTPLNINVKGEDTWDVEIALGNNLD